METASTYFTRRARQERANAAHAASAEARKAHLELAVRLVRVATEPALWAWPERSPAGGAVPQHEAVAGLEQVGHALAGAFPLPRSGSFEQLLDAVDTTER